LCVRCAGADLGAWHRIQVPQVRLTRVELRPRPAAPSPLVPAASTNGLDPLDPTMSALHAARQAPNPPRSPRSDIETGAPVTLINGDGNWSLVARQGHIVGYVETKNLKDCS